MYNRYWRTYPWGLQVFLLMMMVLTLMSFSVYLVLALMPRISGIAYADMFNLSAASPVRNIRASLLAQALSHLGSFAIPAVVFASVTHPRIKEYLGVRAPGKPIHWLLVTGLMLGFLPVSVWGETWMMKHLHFGPWASELQKKTDDMFGAFLKLSSGGDLILLLSVLSLLPAIGEELLFRGVLLRILHRGFNRRVSTEKVTGDNLPPDLQRTMLLPVIGSSMVFALLHPSPYGFVFIFMAGCLLALIYSHTGSLLCSIWAHLLFNGSQVVLAFLSHSNPAMKKLADSDSVPAIYPLVGFVLFVVCFYALVKQQTPLAQDWSDDFKGDAEQSQLPAA